MARASVDSQVAKQSISLQCAGVEPSLGEERETRAQLAQRHLVKKKPSDVCTCCGTQGHKKPECRFRDSKCSSCGRRGHMRAACKPAEETQRVQSGDIPEASQDEADDWRSLGYDVYLKRAALLEMRQRAAMGIEFVHSRKLWSVSTKITSLRSSPSCAVTQLQCLRSRPLQVTHSPI